jgi:hypothetical protein
VIYAHAVSAGGAGSGGGSGAAAGAAGAAGAAAAGTAGAAGTGADSGSGAAGDSSAGETGPGDRLGGAAAGYANDPSVYRSPASAWPGEVEYPSASPRSPGVATSPGTGALVPAPTRGTVPSRRVDTLSTPVMCPGINEIDPRKC